VAPSNFDVFMRSNLHLWVEGAVDQWCAASISRRKGPRRGCVRAFGSQNGQGWGAAVRRQWEHAFDALEQPDPGGR
jgi:hypothetical protein